MLEFTEEDLEILLTEAYTAGWEQRSVDPETGEYLKPSVPWNDDSCANYVCTVITEVTE